MRNVHKCMNEMDLRYINKNETSRAKKIENERNAKKKKSFAQLKSKTFFEGKCIKDLF